MTEKFSDGKTWWSFWLWVFLLFLFFGLLLSTKGYPTYGGACLGIAIAIPWVNIIGAKEALEEDA